MTAFHYKNGVLHAEDAPLSRIAELAGTPAYVYSSAAFLDTFTNFRGALEAEGLEALVCYAVKANPHQAIIASLAAAGAGADIVSEGELRRALAAGVKPDKIVFAGVGKTKREMAAALKAGISQFNVESLPELEALNAVAGELGVTAPVALRINPDVDAKTHAKITTGKSENKFGIDLDVAVEAFAKVEALANLTPKAAAVHIGSQLTELAPFEAAFTRLGELHGTLRDQGITLERLDLGGGLGVAYHEEQPPSPVDYARMVKRTLGHLGLPLIFEPGRNLVANAGVLLTRVLYNKVGRDKHFMIVDAGMNDLIRPTLYEAWHDILPVAEPSDAHRPGRADIVGPVCETGDYFAKDRAMPPVADGELLAICAVGAYGATMTSTYNSRLPAAEVLVKGAEAAIISPRMTYEDLIGRDVLPEWL